MAKSADKLTDGVIREGFLCPVCLIDLKTVDQLQDHFELTHSSEDHDVLQALKGFIGKAKRKILKQDISCNDDEYKASFDSMALNLSSQESFVPWPSQEIGAKTNHMQYFKKLRDKKIDRYVIETNKLLIRLDKLICDISEDPERRKDFEKSIVPWVPDSDVPLCPGCAKSFGISRRRHHCRLCGGVMCHSCSFFINYEFARKLTLPVVSADKQLIPKTNSALRRPSTSSLMSVVNLSGEPLIRICRDCNILLVRQENIVEQKSYKPVIVQMYEKLRECMDETEKLVLVYMEKIESLNSGEMDCNLQDTQELKVKISRLAERIDALSKRITRLESGEECNNREFQLHSGIRMAASQFLRSIVLGLPSVPTQEEISYYQKIRQDQVQRRIQLEKQTELINQNKKDIGKNVAPELSVNTSPKNKLMEPVSPDTGWCVSLSNDRQDEDPMLQQINNICKYIEQARIDHKYDEVQMLEMNLKELQTEYENQHKF